MFSVKILSYKIRCIELQCRVLSRPAPRSAAYTAPRGTAPHRRGVNAPEDYNGWVWHNSWERCIQHSHGNENGETISRQYKVALSWPSIVSCCSIHLLEHPSSRCSIITFCLNFSATAKYIGLSVPPVFFPILLFNVLLHTELYSPKKW